MPLARSAQIADVQWSLTGDRYLVAPASAQAKCFDREGKELYVTWSPPITPFLRLWAALVGRAYVRFLIRR